MSASILVCVTAQKECTDLIRRGHTLSLERGLPLHVLHISESRAAQTARESAEILDELFHLAHESNADMEVLYESDVLKAICRYARDISAQVIVVGRGRSGNVRDLPILLPECEIVVCERV